MAGRRRPARAPISWSTTAISHVGSRPAAGVFEDCAWAYAATAQRRTVSRTLPIYHAGRTSDPVKRGRPDLRAAAGYETIRRHRRPEEVVVVGAEWEARRSVRRSRCRFRW